jgi:hypothetical protein
VACPRTDHTCLYLVLPAIDDLDAAVLALARVGIDAVEGVLAGGSTRGATPVCQSPIRARSARAT